MAQTRLEFLQRERWWIGANIAGIAVYEACAASVSLAPSVRGESNAALWGMTCLPLLLLFAVANLVWLTQRARNDVPAEHWRTVPIVLGVAACWLLALTIDGLLR